MLAPGAVCGLRTASSSWASGGSANAGACGGVPSREGEGESCCMAIRRNKFRADRPRLIVAGLAGGGLGSRVGLSGLYGTLVCPQWSLTVCLASSSFTHSFTPPSYSTWWVIPVGLCGSPFVSLVPTTFALWKWSPIWNSMPCGKSRLFGCFRAFAQRSGDTFVAYGARCLHAANIRRKQAPQQAKKIIGTTSTTAVIPDTLLPATPAETGIGWGVADKTTGRPTRGLICKEISCPVLALSCSIMRLASKSRPEVDAKSTRAPCLTLCTSTSKKIWLPSRRCPGETDVEEVTETDVSRTPMTSAKAARVPSLRCTCTWASVRSSPCTTKLV
mmetsp:Transcript_124637/g.399203  ORF Transcript_124637/g.399203 Transcript_124637/m.399203 type:complete len:331 (+) Transcript_124637:420-1412(+)